MEAVTISAPRRSAPAATTFAGAAEAHLDDVFGYLLYLTRASVTRSLSDGARRVLTDEPGDCSQSVTS